MPVKSMLQKMKANRWLHKMIVPYYILMRYILYWFQNDTTVLLALPENPCPACRTELTLSIEKLTQKGYSWSVGYTLAAKHKEMHQILLNQRRAIERLKPRKWLKYA